MGIFILKNLIEKIFEFAISSLVGNVFLITFTVFINFLLIFRKKKFLKDSHEVFLSFMAVGAGQFATKKFIKGTLFLLSLIVGYLIWYFLDDKDTAYVFLAIGFFGSLLESFINGKPDFSKNKKKNYSYSRNNHSKVTANKNTYGLADQIEEEDRRLFQEDVDRFNDTMNDFNDTMNDTMNDFNDNNNW